MSKKNIRIFIIAGIILVALTACGKVQVNTTPESLRVQGIYEIWPYMELVLFLDEKIFSDEGESPVKETSTSIFFMYKGKKHRGMILNGGDTLAGLWGSFPDIAKNVLNAGFLLMTWKADKVPVEEK